MGTPLIIDGPDGVGKSTFIQRLKDFIEAKGEYANALSAEKTKQLKIGTKGGRKRLRQALVDAGKKPGTPLTRERYPFSVYVANIRDASPENGVFYKRLLAGEIADEREIVKEYIQAHFDLDNYVKELCTVHDLVVIDRALPSFFASQIRGCGQDYAMAAYEALLARTGQGHYKTWILSTSTEEIEKRCTIRGNDEQGKKLHDKLAVVRAAFHEVAQSPLWTDASIVDVTSLDPEAYRTLFTNLANQIYVNTRNLNPLR